MKYKRENVLTESTILKLIKKAKQYESHTAHRGSPGPGLLWLEESILSGAFRKKNLDESLDLQLIENSESKDHCEMCGCQIYDSDDGMCPTCDSTVSESTAYHFDKHIDQILLAEHKHKSIDEKTPTPQRIRAKRHQDRPGNKIIFGSKK